MIYLNYLQFLHESFFIYYIQQKTYFYIYYFILYFIKEII